MKDHSQLLKNKNTKKVDNFTKFFTCGLSWTFSLIFVSLIGFIIYLSIPGFQEYGITNILFTGDFDLNNNKASIWFPLCITIITTTIAVLFAAPIGIKSAIFIKYRIPLRFKKTAKIIIELLAGAPSVIFGLFASQILGQVIGRIFGSNSSYTILTAAFMLTFMLLPTICSLSLNAFDSIDSGLLNSAIVLGNSKTRAIYKVCKKECKNKLTVAIVMAISRAIGETMAVGMVLQSQQYVNAFDSGFWGILNSGLRTLGAFISANMFSESVTPAFQGLLFAFGLFLFIIVICLNIFVLKISNKKSSKNYIWLSISSYVGNFFGTIKKIFTKNWERLSYKSEVSQKDISKYISERLDQNKFANFYSWIKIVLEWISFIITSLFIVTFFGNILIVGLQSIFSQNSTIFSIDKNTTGQAFINTILIIVVAIGLGLPLSLAIAIFINEFAREGKMKKTILFFIDSLGATPSIIFGMFGMIFFLQILGLSADGSSGKSLIAGSLTILIVILPTFIRIIQQALESIPNELRVNSLALGAGRWETIRKIILPMAYQQIMASVVLSIGRILAETAPLFLTSGLSSSATISLSTEGQTLTTRIYAQIFEPNIAKGNSIMYECAFVTILLVLIIILLVYVIFPWHKKWKQKREQEKFDSSNRVKKWWKMRRKNKLNHKHGKHKKAMLFSKMNIWKNKLRDKYNKIYQTYHSKNLNQNKLLWLIKS